ncbi:glycogen synthase GlgA [Alteromonas aestuariivivens]|uniref:Glycogen synthase n=1 Tax=Alteromonas aestuariivivens TaxID=1938339 RepID=A0A3D8M7Q4_9ALTE|nr:glycogen synthase GlgA [Alteromonas aestuariivivens]RDV25567.1 glycogen synthase GlgA [Alteromonas aestuariivivens]
MKIVFAISEVEDLVKTGGLADVGKALPLALSEMGHEVVIVLPYYQAIAREYQLADACPPQTLFAESQVYHYRLKELHWHGIQVYFVDYPEYFDRDGLYSNAYEAYKDNGERFSFFCGAVLSALQAISWQPDVIHCHDWHTAMLPYLMAYDRSGFFSDSKTVFTIHNAAFQGVNKLEDIPFLRHHPGILSQVHGGYINMLQSGIEFAHKVTTVSPNYAQELLTDLGSHGLHDRLVSRRSDMSGILNGCDYSQWDPATDPYLPENYSADNLLAKKTCKLTLQEKSGLPQNADVPLIGMVCRLTEQKGFGYLIPILDDLMSHNLQIVIVGTGDPKVCMDLGEFAQSHPAQFAFINGFSTEHAHLVEAGADFFLMPSQFEPCGLNQMYSLAYGTIPIVRAVGGLKDTVIDLKDDANGATGFVFSAPSSSALLSCIRRALLFYYEHPVAFREMQLRGMATRFTWQAAADSYATLYQSMSGEYRA